MHFEDIFREMEDLIRNLRLFKNIRGFLKAFLMELRLFLNDVRRFQRNRGFLKLYPDK
jgi:hypothetical protein